MLSIITPLKRSKILCQNSARIIIKFDVGWLKQLGAVEMIGEL